MNYPLQDPPLPENYPPQHNYPPQDNYSLPENYPPQDNYSLPENYPPQNNYSLQENYPLTFPNPLEGTINSDDPAVMTIVSDTEYQQPGNPIFIDSNNAQPGDGSIMVELDVDSGVEVQNIQPETLYGNAGGISLLGQIPGIY